jgi:hypothetical protein
MERGDTHCKRARYLEYHSGPTSHGIRRKAESLPLVTGSFIHDIMAGLLREEEAEALIKKQVARYRKRCDERGFLDMDEEDVQRVIAEQSALVEAFGWAAAIEYVPALLAEHDVVLVEEELLFSLTPDLDPQVVLMNRPDAILRKKATGELIQLETKTTGWISSPSWRRQWEDSRQLLLTKLAVEHHLGEEVTFAYVFAFDKSKRSEEKATGLVKQWSPFLYAYHKEGNPPMEEEDWQLRWKWTDDEGNNHTLGKKYKRLAVFEHDFGQPEGMAAVQYWIRALPAEELQTQREILGPFTYLDHVAVSIVRAAAAGEKEWMQRLWTIHEVGEKVGWDEAHPDFIAALDEQVPQSWNCHAFGKDCPYLPICKREPGWEAPAESDRFELRTPHHAPELEQAKARGIELPEDQEEEGEED